MGNTRISESCREELRALGMTDEWIEGYEPRFQSFISSEFAAAQFEAFLIEEAKRKSRLDKIDAITTRFLLDCQQRGISSGDVPALFEEIKSRLGRMPIVFMDKSPE
jgi:hypothetical protein